jgi:hypothetical protein
MKLEGGMSFTPPTKGDLINGSEVLNNADALGYDFFTQHWLNSLACPSNRSQRCLS